MKMTGENTEKHDRIMGNVCKSPQHSHQDGAWGWFSLTSSNAKCSQTTDPRMVLVIMDFNHR